MTINARLAPHQIPTAPYWADVLAAKDTMSYAELSERFGPSAWAIRAAFERAGISKTPMPRGPRAFRKLDPEDAPVLAGSTDVLAALAGKAPDAEVAERVGVEVEQVKAYRRDHGIPPFLRAPPTRGGSASIPPAPAAPLIAEAATPAAANAKVVRRRVSADGSVRNVVVREEPVRVPVAPAKQAAETASPSPATGARNVARRGRPSRLDTFVGELGTVPDRVIAAKAGVGVPAVAQYRLRRGIPAAKAAASAKVPVPPIGPAPDSGSPRAMRRSRGSKLDAMRHLLGTLPDQQLAEMAGVTRKAVVTYRAQHGISAYEGHRVAKASSAVRKAPESVPASEPALQLTPAAPTGDDEPDVTDRARPALPSAHDATGDTPAMSAFRVRVRSVERKACFTVLGADMLDALVRADRVLALRTDGPWTVVKVRYLSEALVDGPADTPVDVTTSSTARSESERPRVRVPRTRTPASPAPRAGSGARALARSFPPRGRYRSPGEETFELLTKLAEEGASPSERERVLAEFAEVRGSTSDAVRAAARRYAIKYGLEYPRMRAPATHNRVGEREALRQKRAARNAERLRVGAEALARGATWAEIATLFGLGTGEGAYQWWSRHGAAESR